MLKRYAYLSRAAATLSIATMVAFVAADTLPAGAAMQAHATTQAALTLTSTSGVVGTPLTLTSSGGSGTGAVSYSVTSFGTAGCGITGGALNAARVGTCTVTVTKAADATYSSASSPATTVTFVAAALKAQAALTLTSTNGIVGTPLKLTSSGGSGTGAVTYGVTSTGTAGCGIAAGDLNAARVGTCTVTVTKAADATYAAASSPITTVAFVAAALKVQAALILTSTRGTAGAPLTLTSIGGSGSGAVTYGVTDAGSAGCGIVAGQLISARAGTCTVMVTKAGDAKYATATSPVTTVVLSAVVLKAQSPLVLTSTHGTAGTALKLTWSGGSGTGAVSFHVTSFGTAGCGIVAGELHAARGGSCTVTVTKAGDATYAAATSAATTLRFDAQFGASRVVGVVWVGRTSTVAILGSGFYSKPAVRSNEARTSANVIHDYGHELVVRVTVLKGVPQGWHVFTIILPNGRFTQVRYLVKFLPVLFTATRVNGIVSVGGISTVAIVGAGFYSKPTVRSNEAGTIANVIHDYGHELIVRVALVSGATRGWHVFTIILANGHFTRVKYLVK